ncbi:MAG: hypothetical protein M3322_13490 [Actinomycetota bacterium]|nr:hypothetical protein [Actinomycetota bacterium]
MQPPTSEHVEAVVRLLPQRYGLPTLVLDGDRVADRRARGVTGTISTSRAAAGRGSRRLPGGMAMI